MADTFEGAKSRAKQQGRRSFRWQGREYNVETTMPKEQEDAAFAQMGIGPGGATVSPQAQAAGAATQIGEGGVTAAPVRSLDPMAQRPLGPYPPAGLPPTPTGTLPWNVDVTPQAPMVGGQAAQMAPVQSTPQPTTSIPAPTMAPAMGDSASVNRVLGMEQSYPGWIAPQAPPAPGFDGGTMLQVQDPNLPFPLAPGVTPQEGGGAAPPGAQGPDGFGAAGSQLPPNIAPGPPRTPEELEQRKSGWREFMNRVQSDPQLAMMFLRFGTMVAQPIQPGQSSGGHFANAVQGGVDYQREVNLQMDENRRRDQVAQQTERRTNIAERQVDSEISARNMEATEARETKTLRYDMLSQQVANAKTAGELTKLEAEIKKRQGSAERLKMLDDFEKRELDIREKAALASLAAARAQLTRVQKEPSTLELAKFQASLKALSAAAFVRSVDDDIRRYAEGESKRGRALTTDAARNEFFSQYGNLAQEYYQAQSEAALQTPGDWSRGATGDATVEEPRGMATPAGEPTPAEIARAENDPNLKVDIVRGPDGRLIRKIVPARPVQTPGPGAAGAAPKPPAVPMVPYR